MNTVDTKKSLKSFSHLALIAVLIAAAPLTALSKVQPREQPPAVKEVTISVTDAFIPGGFDSEADAYIVVNGLFPNGCYRWKSAEVTSEEPFNHNIRSVASVSQGMCIMVLVPFTKEVRLGKLASGTHTLKFLNGDGTFLQKTLSIE